jgi:hypothetical protein
MNDSMKTPDQDVGALRRAMLPILWIFVLLNMVYADILSLMDPASPIRRIMAGAARMPAGLVVGAILMETSIGMILLSRILPRQANRWANVAAVVINLPAVLLGGRGAYYYFFAGVETLSLIAILVLAVRWPQAEPEQAKGANPPPAPTPPRVPPAASSFAQPTEDGPASGSPPPSAPPLQPPGIGGSTVAPEKNPCRESQGGAD